jgi:hypothetical protein
MMEGKRMIAGLALIAVMVLGWGTGANAAGGETRLRAGLAGARVNGMTPSGVAEFRSRADGSRRVKVQVEKLNLGEGTKLNVLIDGVPIGQITLNALLAGELQLNTNDGDQIPPVGKGSTAFVTDEAGTTMVAGTF